MNGLPVYVWRRKGRGRWERVSGPLSTVKAAAVEAEANQAAIASSSPWRYTSFPVAVNPND